SPLMRRTLRVRASERLRSRPPLFGYPPSVVAQSILRRRVQGSDKVFGSARRGCGGTNLTLILPMHRCCRPGLGRPHRAWGPSAAGTDDPSPSCGADRGEVLPVCPQTLPWELTVASCVASDDSAHELGGQPELCRCRRWRSGSSSCGRRGVLSPL